MKEPKSRRACYLDSDKQGVRVEVCPDAGDVIVTAYKGRKVIGQAVLEPSHGARAVKVGEVEVEPSARRGGIGTRLYEAAVRVGCRAGLAVSSDSMRSPYAEAFWRKQAGKGRAACEPGAGKVYDPPGGVEGNHLPVPNRGDTWQGDTWPCERYVVRTPCQVPSLAGLPGRKTASRTRAHARRRTRP